MRFSHPNAIFLAAALALCISKTSLAQDAHSQNPQGPETAPVDTTRPPAAPTVASVPAFNARDYLPLCSTEKVNGNCFVNIDRRYPIAMPTFQVHKGAHITVYVFHPFAFESLTLDTGTTQALQASDQASGLLNAVIPLGKGASLGTFDVQVRLAGPDRRFMAEIETQLSPQLEKQPQEADDVKRAEAILAKLSELDQILTLTLAPLSNYVSETKDIYGQIREIEAGAPRPGQDLNGSILRAPGVKAPPTPNPWEKYADWREFMIAELKRQGSDTSNLLAGLPGPCQKAGELPPAAGPWLAPARTCKNPSVATQSSDTPLAIPAHYDDVHQELETLLENLPPGRPDPDTYSKIQTLKQQLETRHQHVSDAIVLALDLLPAMITKISTDMQSIFTNIIMARDPVSDPIMVGIISGPNSLKRTPDEKKVLSPYKALGPQITYTLNGQNEIISSLLSLPAASQKQAIVTITALFASPRFEVSTGAFFSWLPNQTFSNRTDVNIKAGVPTPVDVKIGVTKTVAPLIIPYAAANYRISQEYNWLGGRRSAFYTTLGVGLNPYNTQVEYVGGLGFSWRYLMFNPLYHLGHGVHLTQAEEVGQTWCVFGASPGSNPPPCGGSSPSPSTRNYWRGAFAIGVSVRIPTTFSSSNR